MADRDVSCLSLRCVCTFSQASVPPLRYLRMVYKRTTPPSNGATHTDAHTEPSDNISTAIQNVIRVPSDEGTLSDNEPRRSSCSSNREEPTLQTSALDSNRNDGQANNDGTSLLEDEQRKSNSFCAHEPSSQSKSAPEPRYQKTSTLIFVSYFSGKGYAFNNSSY